MKKFLALLIALICVFAVAFTACEDLNLNGNGNGSGTDGDGTGNGQEGEDPDDEDPDAEDPDHECDYEVKWTYDSENHWHASDCTKHPDNKSGVAPHNYVGGRCEVCLREETYGVGDKLPTFVVETFESSYKESTYSTENAQGKVLILNFWYTQCGPCKEEMPIFERFAQEYADDLVVVALHASGANFSSQVNSAQSAINGLGWSDYKIIFGKDNTDDDIFKKCGGGTTWPVTVVADRQGKIVDIIYGQVIRVDDWETMVEVDHLTPAVERALAS